MEGDAQGLSAAFEAEKYRLDRAHELELNKFTHALEMERLKLLTALNGGAAAAWLTFSGSDDAAPGGWSAAALVAPTLFWLGGLILASLATQAALRTQRAFTQAYHRRRRADEWRILGAGRVAEALPRATGRRADETDAAAYGRRADDAMTEGVAAADSVSMLAFASVGVFVLGALAAGGLTLLARAKGAPVLPVPGG